MFFNTAPNPLVQGQLHVANKVACAALKTGHMLRCAAPDIKIELPFVPGMAAGEYEITVDRSVQVPKRIWLYSPVPADAMAPHLRLCLLSVAKWNTEFEVTLVTDDNVARYLPDGQTGDLRFADLHPLWHQLADPAHKADVVRTLILLRYGGVWLDTGSICLDSFGAFVDRMNRDGKTAAVWQREWAADVGTSALLMTPRHPIAQRMAETIHHRLTQKLLAAEINSITLRRPGEFGADLLAEASLRYLWQTRHVTPYPFDLRDIGEIEPFSEAAAGQWIQPRTDDEAGVLVWFRQQTHTKYTQPQDHLPLLTFADAELPASYRADVATTTIDQFKSAPPHYLNLALCKSLSNATVEQLAATCTVVASS